jgi:hypothetical protein
MVTRKSFCPVLPCARRDAEKWGNFSSHDEFFCAVSRCRHRRATCRGNDTAQFATLEGAVGTVRRNDPRRNGRDIHRIWLQKGNRTQIATEVTVATGFFTAALAALWITPWIVPVAYVAHGIWDYAHHQGSKLASVPVKLVAIPLWYPSFCAVYDWVAAASLAVIWDLRV